MLNTFVNVCQNNYKLLRKSDEIIEHTLKCLHLMIKWYTCDLSNPGQSQTFQTES